MTKMYLTITDLDGYVLAEGNIEMPIVPIGAELRFDDSTKDYVFFVKIIAYDIHMTPIMNGTSKATHMHAFGELMNRSSYDIQKGTLEEAISFAAFDPASQAHFSKEPKGSLVEKT